MAGFGSTLQIVVLTNGSVAQYHAIRNADGSWTHWGDINSQVDFGNAGFQGTVLQEISATNVSGQLQLVFASGDNQGTLYHTIRRADGTRTPAALVQSAVKLSAWRPVFTSGAAG